jgi:hypothetical protein
MGRADALKPGRRKDRHLPLPRSELPIDTVSLECPFMGRDVGLWLDPNGCCPPNRAGPDGFCERQVWGKSGNLKKRLDGVGSD